MKLENQTMIYILAPLVKGRTGTYEELFSRLLKEGFTRVRIDNKIYELEESIKLDRYKKHSIDILVDRIKVSQESKSRIADSVETSLKQSKGLVSIAVVDDNKNVKKETVYSEHYACTDCAISIPEIEPRLFSFNSPFGACPECGGLGNKIEVDEDLVVPENKRTINEGVIRAWSEPITTRTHRWKNAWGGYYNEILEGVCKENKIPMNKPWTELTSQQKNEYCLIRQR
jgi:excinuclease ABC subunit A